MTETPPARAGRSLLVDEVAARYDITTEEVWARVAAGKLPKPFFIGGEARWRLADLDAWDARGGAFDEEGHRAYAQALRAGKGTKAARERLKLQPEWDQFYKAVVKLEADLAEEAGRERELFAHLQACTARHPDLPPTTMLRRLPKLHETGEVLSGGTRRTIVRPNEEGPLTLVTTPVAIEDPEWSKTWAAFCGAKLAGERLAYIRSRWFWLFDLPNAGFVENLYLRHPSLNAKAAELGLSLD